MQLEAGLNRSEVEVTRWQGEMRVETVAATYAEEIPKRHNR